MRYALSALIAAAAALGAAAAQAHVSLQPTTATAGAHQVLRFVVGHGCDGQATTALRIEMPPGVASARPQPKPGWRLTIEHPPGQPEAVSAVTWRGRLPADQFDEFLVFAKLPAAAGEAAFPAIQTCGSTVVRWAAPPGPGEPHPAPHLTLVAPAGPDPHAHHHHQANP
jgi:uncharacterized protein YcnI